MPVVSLANDEDRGNTRIHLPRSYLPYLGVFPAKRSVLSRFCEFDCRPSFHFLRHGGGGGRRGYRHPVKRCFARLRRAGWPTCKVDSRWTITQPLMETRERRQRLSIDPSRITILRLITLCICACACGSTTFRLCVGACACVSGILRLSEFPLPLAQFRCLLSPVIELLPPVLINRLSRLK